MATVIVEKARELFFTYGIKSVSMDDLARIAGISKKTIYQFFPDKNALVNRIVEELVNEHLHRCRQCQEEAKDAIDEVLRQSGSPFDTWVSVNPGLFYELEKFFPQAWKQLEQHRQNVLVPAIRNNLANGMAAGLYRPDLDTALTADIRIQQMVSALQPHSFTRGKKSVRELMRELTVFYLHGITTEKGKKLVAKYLKNTNEKESV